VCQKWSYRELCNSEHKFDSMREKLHPYVKKLMREKAYVRDPIHAWKSRTICEKAHAWESIRERPNPSVKNYTHTWKRSCVRKHTWESQSMREKVDPYVKKPMREKAYVREPIHAWKIKKVDPYVYVPDLFVDFLEFIFVEKTTFVLQDFKLNVDSLKFAILRCQVFVCYVCL